MRLSNLLGERFKEDPSEAFMCSHKYLLRGGYIRQVAKGIFSMLTPAKRVSQKIEAIIRSEMDNVDGQEVMFPVVLPASLWRESGRFDSVGNELMRMKDRTGQDMVLGMTHEEASVHLARGEAKTYTKYPFMIYQIQTKFRDEPRSRGGLVRVREFTMKDAYSFHTSHEDLEQYYQRVHVAYENIYNRVGLNNVISILSDSGMMGGNKAHEFMYISDDGEDSIITCSNCDYKSNMEVAESSIINVDYGMEDIQEIHTPNTKTIEDLCKSLDIKDEQTLKATLFVREDNNKIVLAFIRGDKQVNEAKIKKVLGINIFPFTDSVIDGLTLGFIGPYKLGNDDIDIVYDISLKDTTNLICGANKKDYHYKGFNINRDIKVNEYHDIAKVNQGEICTICGNELNLNNGIEVGNIFQLGKKYTTAMNMTYTDKDGKLQIPTMGCYGIGVGRTLACVIEENHDDYGPIWPKTVAPWQVQICVLNTNVDEIMDTGNKLYNLIGKSYETIIDDRKVSTGVKFADADLLGVPLKIVVSKRSLANNEVEVSSRNKNVFREKISLEALLNDTDNVLSELWARI